MLQISNKIATELNVREQQVCAAIALLDDGATVPFIARYRKEATDSLNDTQLRKLEERLKYLREMNERCATILSSIKEQGKLTKELEQKIQKAETKNRLEDLYLPFKPKRRTKAYIAKEAGLEPLADSLLADPTLNPEIEAAKYLNEAHKITDNKAALDGARQILMERFSEQADLLEKLRNEMWQQGVLASKVVAKRRKEGVKYRDYFAYQEKLNLIPSHRALAIFRGRREGVLQITVDLPELIDAERLKLHPFESIIAYFYNITFQERAADTWLREVVRWTWKVKLSSYIETELLARIRESADQQAIEVFSKNLANLLMAAPAGAKATMGLDPGLRTGVKVAIVDCTGKFLDYDTIFPHNPHNRWTDGLSAIAKLVLKYNVEFIAIGNGTASRETERLVDDLLKQFPSIKVKKAMVNESGASVYSASEVAAKEFPDLDVSFRGAVSIARRLQDPLAELVKIDPKSIGVGQYQHDVSQSKLVTSLNCVVGDCVNAVGVDLNTASSELLSYVSGLNAKIACNIIEYRNTNGAFRSRTQLTEVAQLGEKTFEQCAGFMRIRNGENPLDASGVHPESYPVIQKIIKDTNRELQSIMGDGAALKRLTPENYCDEQFGKITVSDIIKELEKPGRDPRPEFKTANFREGVETIKDLKLDMVLEGVVTNVTKFGAFVDIGVHQDGLVHISALTNGFVKDPADVVKAGDIVKVKVLEVDVERSRIGLSMRLSGSTKQPVDRSSQGKREQRDLKNKERHATAKRDKAKVNTGATFADLFASAKKLRR